MYVPILQASVIPFLLPEAKNTYYDYPDGGYSHIEYGDETVFEVTKENDLIRLYAYIDE